MRYDVFPRRWFWAHPDTGKYGSASSDTTNFLKFTPQLIIGSIDSPVCHTMVFSVPFHPRHGHMSLDESSAGIKRASALPLTTSPMQG